VDALGSRSEVRAGGHSAPKQEISCEYDEQMVIGAEKTERVDEAPRALYTTPLPNLAFEVFSDLAGLSGSVNAKTVYSA
jgi:hypothetical protein